LTDIATIWRAFATTEFWQIITLSLSVSISAAIIAAVLGVALAV
jgi:ABC-type sulfate transport system permease component